MELMMKSLFVVAVILFVENSQVLTDDTDSGCSGEWPGRKQSGTSGVITSPNYPGNYGDNLRCEWRIDTPQNMLSRISFDPIFELDRNTTSGYCHDDVSIYNYQISLYNDVYCDKTAPPTRYYSGFVYIQFRSDMSLSYKGFKLFWRYFKVDSTCSKTPIIQNGTSGVISSPNYPNNYYHGLDCRWLILAPENTVLRISFDPIFELERKTISGHCRDKVSIYTDPNYVNHDCGNTAPPTRNYSGGVTIKFVTIKSDNSGIYKGFRLYWQLLKVDSCSKTPIIQNGTSGVITSPNYPGKYYNNLDCRWLIDTPENRMVEISFNSNFHIQPRTSGGCHDALTIKSETGKNLNTLHNVNDFYVENGDVYCGSTAPPTRNYSGGVTIKFTSDNSGIYKGFKLFWRYLKVDSCSKTPIIQNGTSGVISSPNHPGNYYRRLDCRWLIQTPENRIVEISFDSNFSMGAKTGDNCHDALTIKSGTVNVYCGNTAPPTRNYTGRVIIRFTSGSYDSYKGFRLFWRFLKVDSCSKTPIIQNGRSGVISSPNYPNKYYRGLDCRWLIQTPENTIVEISFDSNFSMGAKTGDSCYDALTIKSGTENGDVYCGNTAPPTRVYSGEVVIRFTSDMSGSYKGFKLCWKFVKVDSCSKTPITQNGRSGVITSPNYPNSYNDNIDCSWLIQAPENRMVEISFDSKFHIQTSKGRCWDALTIKSETGSNQYCGSTAPDNRSHTGNITIQFTSDNSGSDAGFKLLWRIKDKDTDRISYLTVVFGIGFLIIVIVAAIAIAVLIRQRRNVRNRNTGNNTTDPGAMYYQPSSSGVGGRIYTTQDGIYEDIDDGEIYDDVDIVDVVVAGVRNATENDVDVRNATDDDVDVRNATDDDVDVRNATDDDVDVRNATDDDVDAWNSTDDDVDAWNSTDDDVDVWNSTDDDVDDNLVADVRNPPEDDYVGPDVMNPPEDTYIVAGVRNPPEDDYVGPDVMNPPEDTYIVTGVRNPPEDDYVVVAGVRNTPEDTYIVPDARNSSEDDYVVVPNIRNTPEDTYIVAGVRNPPEDTYIVALKPTATSADDRISPEDDYVGPDVRYSTEDTYVVAGVRNPPEDTYIVPDARNCTEDDYVVVAGVRNPPEDDYFVVAGVRNTPEDTYIVPDARNSSEDDYVVVAGVRNPPEDTYVVPDIRNTPEDTYIVPDVRNPPEDTYVVADGIRPQLDDNGTMD
ncbi:cubilin-like isoform X2 [Tubulanus polymorphus]|uniref:cubilin-like isoform X2 n=1 Tax=Tubulanus polymorphus TaxID=672921 RepID=UPI003DA69334